MKKAVSRPSMLLLLSEPGRALFELGMSYSYSKVYKSTISGDGHPVMVLPGFMSSRRSTVYLRQHLKKCGYTVYDWGLGRNVGKLESVDLLIEKLEEIYNLTGEKISLVGWSLGGVFARQAAKARPEIIQQIITLGSPFAGLTEPNNVAWLYSLITGGKEVKDVDQAFLDNVPLPAPVPTTAIYSKEDGVVPWEMCLEKEDSIHQNIRVRGSHIGLGVNMWVLSIIENRLKEAPKNWQKFKPTGFLSRTLFYPES